MKNIGILISRLSDGGAERAAANLSAELSKHYKVHILMFSNDPITYPYQGTLYRINVPASKWPWVKAWHVFLRCWRIKQYKKQHNIHTMISFMTPPNLYNVLTKGKDKAIISIRNTMSERYKSKLNRWLISWCGRHADMTVAVSEDVRQDLLKYFAYNPQKVVTIRNLCDTAVLQNSNPQIDRLTAQFDFQGGTIVTVGRFTQQKAQWHLLRAFGQLLPKHPQAKLVFFGQGELKKPLQEYADKLGIQKNTFFMGYVKNQHTFLRKCDIFVLPSFFEGLSNALLEAMACGLPAISTACQSEVLSDQLHVVSTLEQAPYGILIPPFVRKPFKMDDLEIEPNDLLLAQAMEKLLTDTSLNAYYRAQALKRIQDFSPKNITQQWINVIEEQN